MPGEVRATPAQIRHGVKLVGQIMRKLDREGDRNGRSDYPEAAKITAYGSKWIDGWNLMARIIAAGRAGGSWKLDALERRTKDASKKLIATDANRDGRVTGAELHKGFKTGKGAVIAAELLRFAQKHKDDTISDLKKPKRKRTIV